MNFKNALFLLMTAALIERSYSEVLGCGGFVKLSAQFRDSLSATTSSPIDFTKVSVRLLSRGSDEVKMSTECSPTGYFFVPSYDTGDYDLTVVDTANGDAITFAPSRIPVTIGGSSSASDLNNLEFEITGVTITGDVTGVASASDVVVTLISAATKSVVGTANPDAAGHYRFGNVLPGRYEIAAARGGWRFKPSYVTLDVTGAPQTQAPALTVAGFDVTGAVLLDNGNSKKAKGGLGDVTIALYSPVSGVECIKSGSSNNGVPAPVPQSVNEPASGKRMELVDAAVTAAGSGAFVFEGVPAGEYVVVPYFVGERAGYQASKAMAALTVGEQSAALAEPFVVTGFAVRGRVVDTAGAGIEGASVRLGKLGAATTDAAGEYTIAGLAPATAVGASAKLSVSKKHYTFEESERAVTIESSGALPTVRAAKYDVCGTVTVVVAPAGTRPYPRTVVAKDVATGATESVKTGTTGAFCVALGPGKYALSVAEDAGLEMEPASRAVTVAAGPVAEGVDFRQKTLAVAGEIRALAPVSAPKSVEVVLTAAASGIAAKRASVELAAGAATAKFAFEGLVAGTYTVSVANAAADKEWCWGADAKQTITVTKERSPEVVIAQKGYRMTVTATHALTVAATLDGAEKAVFAVGPAEPASVCLAAPGTYALEVRTEGYEFEAPSYAFSTADVRPVAIRAARFRVTGTVTAVDAAAAAAISVGTAEGIPVATRVTEGNAVEYTAFVAAGASVRFIPTSSAEGTMFYPTERVVRVAEGAPVVADAIAARPGLYMRGRVTPATEGVRVSIVVRGAAEGTPAVMSVLTDASGAYVAGPLRDDAEYREIFKHKGLVFNCTNCAGAEAGAERVVLAMRLSSITVTVREAGADGAPVPGVLVSVSGGFGDSIYATNAATEADGSFTSGEIFPGSYFVRPMLKEYTFEPATRSVEVAEGDAPEVVFAATRVAFSAHGRVLALDGTPQRGVTVLATAAKSGSGTSEQGITDDDGRYRIRGLVPGAEYTVTVAGGGQAATPRSHTVTIEGAKDATDIDFVAYAGTVTEETGAATGRITARIDAERSVLPTLDAVLKRAGSAATAAAVQRAKVGAIPIVEFGFVEPGKYELSLESALSKKHYSCKSTPEVLEVEVKSMVDEQVSIAIVCGEEREENDNVDDGEKVVKAGGKASVLSLIGVVAALVASMKYKEIVVAVKGEKAKKRMVTAEEIAESMGVDVSVAAKRAKYINLTGGAEDKSDFLPQNPNTSHHKKKKTGKK